MNVEIKYGQLIKDFENKTTIIIGSSQDSDFVIDDMAEDILIKMIYSSKYKNYVLINALNNNGILFNNKPFSKVLVPAHFSLTVNGRVLLIIINSNNKSINFGGTNLIDERNSSNVLTSVSVLPSNQIDEIFNNEIEENRVNIVREIGANIQLLKSNISSLNITSLAMNAAMFVLSIVCSFGMTNYLLGLKIDNTKSVLNLTTNYWFLVCMSAIVVAIAFILKQAVYTSQEFSKNKRYGESNIPQIAIMYISAIFIMVIYVLNFFYYKEIPGLEVASIFLALFFAGALAVVSVAGGYFRYQLKNTNYKLLNCEFRPDFESVLKAYRGLISAYINNMSKNKINYVKGILLNNQIKMVLEVFIGLVTAPFLAYGVSNTLAMCFPEAANWVRISGLRFSPIFLVLATFLIVFAFFSFVRGFSISKQMEASEIIKFDGFHDYSSHGVTILGLDAMRSLEKEKRIALFIASLIILIEFTMNVSYFVTEIGTDIAGMFKSFITALVPTALLIAETHLLSGTMHKIRNYSELLSKLD